MSQCTGCFPVYQPNQLAHTDYGGCMYSNDEDDTFFCMPVNLEPKFEAEAKASETASEVSAFDSIGTGTECCICYEIIGKKNNCVTECGHIFCFKCLATAMTRSNTCPYCRTKLIDEPADNNDDDLQSDYEDDEEDDEEDSLSDIANKEYNGDIEDIVRGLEEQGFTMLDVVSVMLNKFSKTNEKYTNEYVAELCNKIDDMNRDNENESLEREEMESEDRPPVHVASESVLARLGNYVEN